MIWLLIVISTGGYNMGNVTQIEFNSQQDCIAARKELRRLDYGQTESFCAKKGDAR